MKDILKEIQEKTQKSLKEIQENFGQQAEVMNEETQKSLKELQESTNKQVKELSKNNPGSKIRSRNN